MSKLIFTDCEANFEEADIVLFGAPYDATSTHRKGSKLAPKAIRKESVNVETYSPYIERDLLDISVHDAGDLVFKSAAPATMVNTVEAEATMILDAGKFPVLLGGEHLVTLGAFRAIHKKYKDVCLIHFDAHTDLRDDWCGEKLNHSTVIRRCFDVLYAAPLQGGLGALRIFQFGIRSGERAEFEWAKQNTSLCKHDFSNLDSAIHTISNRPVYFTIDLDILDPSEFGGTGTPEAGGVSFRALMEATTKVFKNLNVVGCDITELSPPYDSNGTSTALACKYIREVLLLIK